MIADHTHTEDCIGGPGECQPIEGQWDQPGGFYRAQAEGELGDDAPFCRIVERAAEIQDEEEVEA